MKIITQQAVLEDLDNMLFLVDQLIKLCKNNIETDQKTTDALNRLIMDCYTGYHPDNTTTKKADRFALYSKLSDNLTASLERYAGSKKTLEKSTQNLLDTAEKLTEIKLTLQK